MSGARNSIPAPVNPNTELAINASKAREEGELPSSDDDELPRCSGAPILDATVPAVPMGPLLPMTKDTGEIKAGKSTSEIKHASSIENHSKASLEPKGRSFIEKNQIPMKSHSPGWFQPTGTQSDLVIKFSDDDTGSESEESRQEKTSETKGSAPEVTGNRRPLAPAHGKLEIIHQAAKGKTKPMPRKISPSRTFMPSMIKTRGPNSGNVASSVWRGSRVGNLNTLNKKYVARPEAASNQRIVSNSTQLHDLRQQIAMREKELKIKSSQQNKERAPGLYKEYSIMNLNDATGKARAASADIEQSDTDEPDMKRIKITEASSNHQNLSVHQELPRSKSTSKVIGIVKKDIKMNDRCSSPFNLDLHQDFHTSKSVIPVEVPVIVEKVLQDKKMVDHSCCEKIIPMGRSMPITAKWQKQDYRHVSALKGSLPSEGKEGADMVASCSQSERTARLLDPLVQNQASLSSAVARRSLLRRSSSMELRHPSKVIGNSPSCSSPSKAALEQSCMRSSENHEMILGGKTLLPASVQECSVRVPDKEMEFSDVSLNAATMLNYMDEVNISHGQTDVQSLVEIEEWQDKELEEAQEHRRRCEIEERNALKAYRKAQRALIEANSRCTYLYRQRELYSARFRSLIVEDSSLLFSSRQQNHIGFGLNSSNNVSEVDADLVPALNHQRRGQSAFDQPAYDSAVQFVEGTHLHALDRNADGQNLGSEACSEPDVSTSELVPQKLGSVANGFCSPSIDPSTSGDEDEETFSPGLKSVQPKCQGNDESCEERKENLNNESKIVLSLDKGEDTLCLEESLRSKLFARLGTRASKNTAPPQVVEPTVERKDQNDDGSEKSHMGMDIGNASEAENNQYSDPEEEGRVCIKDDHRFLTSISVSPVLLSVLSHINFALIISATGLPNRDKQGGSSGIYSREVSCDKVQPRPSILREDSLQQAVKDRSVGENGSYTSNVAIDPFWPLCMYELRGKCNNEECPWQHVRKYSCSRDQHDNSNNADSLAGQLSRQGKLNGAIKFSKSLNSHVVLSLPTYLVSLDILISDLNAYECVLAQSVGRCWQKCFSTSLAVPSLLGGHLALNDPFLLGSDSRVEVQGSWNRLSMYFRSRSGKVDQLKEGLVDKDQTLEMVFLDLNQDVNKSEGTTKALETLSRALEADPTSTILWVVYLHIFYSDKKTIGKDDMFFHAIKHNEGCYELWLMYVNSRLHLDDRLVAYDTALSALCHNASAPVSDEIYASACILDLFLQMMDCFCMSGDGEKAICRICGLFLNATDSNSAHSLLLSDVFECLTVSDKCIFWICCIYLVIYRKLPNEISRQFEFGKELFAIEWPSVNLTADDKQRAIKLMELAVDSIASCIDGESNSTKPAHTSVHMFAVNHIRCVTALSGLDCSEHLLARYTRLYPSCLELCLMSARIQTHDSGDSSFVGFEEALDNWPKEIPGVQCIWNQYVECSLRNGRVDFAKELMARWFRSAWRVQYNRDEILNTVGCGDGDNLNGNLLESVSATIPDSSISDSNHVDIMFGFLNLCLYRLLQNDHHEARLAINRALKVAAPKEFMHCVREHAMLLLTDGPQLKEGFSPIRILNVLKGYLVDTRASQELVPLSRKFIQSIKKPRVHQLMNSLLSPLSPDFSLVNTVLEVWYGPPLLPQQFGRLKSLADFVEAIMDITPSNYHLAISVCRLLMGGSKSDEVVAPNVLFWAASLLVNAILQAVPVAPEYVWSEAAGIFSSLTDVQALSESFHRRALSVYPFSIKLWRSYFNLAKVTGNVSTVVEAARERGIILE